jgi:atrial natriuretic peptide receptor A
VQEGLTGEILINENGDREADYALNDMDPETGFMVPVATYYGARRAYEELAGNKISWPGSSGQAPKDIPRCGFMGDEPTCKIPGMLL